MMFDSRWVGLTMLIVLLAVLTAESPPPSLRAGLGKETWEKLNPLFI